MCVRGPAHPPTPACACRHTLMSAHDHGQVAGAHVWPPCADMPGSTSKHQHMHMHTCARLPVSSTRTNPNCRRTRLSKTHTSAAVHPRPAPRRPGGTYPPRSYLGPQASSPPAGLEQQLKNEQQLLLHPLAVAPCSRYPGEAEEGVRKLCLASAHPVPMVQLWAFCHHTRRPLHDQGTR